MQQLSSTNPGMRKSFIVTFAFVFIVFCTATIDRPAWHSPAWHSPALDSRAFDSQASNSSTLAPRAVPDSGVRPKPATVKPGAPVTSKKPLATGGKKLPPLAAKAEPAAAEKADIDAGKQLLATSDCLTCHKVQEKVVGPAYADVARKYPASDTNIGLLANKIISGGGGVWGPAPMTPHASLSQEDARKMVRYILSLSSK